MFELVHLSGTPKEELPIVTKARRHLRNFIAPEPDHMAKNFYAAKREKFRGKWTPRKPATGCYNCAGMVWTSRRAVLFEPEDWRHILNDDNYRQLEQGERPHICDVILYIRKGYSEILHVAMVFNVAELTFADASAKPITFALSKWDNQSGEDSHRLHDVHLNGGEDYTIEIWTDRPLPEKLRDDT